MTFIDDTEVVETLTKARNQLEYTGSIQPDGELEKRVIREVITAAILEFMG